MIGSETTEQSAERVSLPTASAQEQRPNASEARCNKIAFFGHFGWGNFGNESTLQATLSRFRHLKPDAAFNCICTDPEKVATDYNIKAVSNREVLFRSWTPHNPLARWARTLAIGVPNEIYRWLKAFSVLWGTRALVVPGTGVLNDAYGLFGWGPYELFRWSVTARLCGCKLLVVSVGAGPIYTRAGRFSVKKVLSLAAFRSYRDDSSKRYLTGIGFRADDDPVYPDLAFSLPPGLLPRGRDKRNGCRTVVGLGLMEYAGKYGVERPPDALRRVYLETLMEFVKWLLANDYDIRLLIGDLADVPVTREFKELLKTRSVTPEEGRIIDEPVASVEDLLSQLASTDLVVATRFHNVLLSLLVNKPVIAISFHHKCASLMSQMGLSEYCLDINNLETDKLVAKFCEIEQNTVQLKATIQEKVEYRRKALEEQYRVIFETIFPGLSFPEGRGDEAPDRDTEEMECVPGERIA